MFFFQIFQNEKDMLIDCCLTDMLTQEKFNLLLKELFEKCLDCALVPFKIRALILNQILKNEYTCFNKECLLVLIKHYDWQLVDLKV